MRYTKGPWRRGEGLREIDGEFEGEWVQLASVGHTRWLCRDNEKNRRYRAESDANFELMLLAPELLTALGDMLFLVGGLYDPDKVDAGQLVEDARAVVARAMFP